MDVSDPPLTGRLGRTKVREAPVVIVRNLSLAENIPGDQSPVMRRPGGGGGVKAVMRNEDTRLGVLEKRRQN